MPPTPPAPDSPKVPSESRLPVSRDTMSRLALNMQGQPNDTTCGPTCLQATYEYFGDPITLDEVVAETHELIQGGTLAVLLGTHALSRGYDAIVYSYNLEVFDPTWSTLDSSELAEKLDARRRLSPTLASRGLGHNPRLPVALDAYHRFLTLGGACRFDELSADLIRRYLNLGLPILTGVSATHLYRCRRINDEGKYDDVGGMPEGHFVVLSGYDAEHQTVQVSDPWSEARHTARNYWVSMDRLINAILLGVLTYDANLLVIKPKAGPHSERPLSRHVVP
ncbi:MAG: C39 family peptidase [Polyangiaceae bacterium]|nr:C39 family peptidase [Polyangiaceae bacterium]